MKQDSGKESSLSMHCIRIGGEVQLHSFLTWTLGGGEWPSSRPGSFIPGIGPQQ